ncbi:putative hyalin-like [Apostichopus japonicus]|uniref:Putative hyalin-like n=1 Tax=Stichopus japonicus TaxID=307972 RepID=A0A2G8KN00_STIJA|nr:putative hyalin-like [Apostichopus japonicus]
MFTSCPNTTIVVETDVDRSYSSNVTWTEPVATDNTLIQGVTSNYSPGQNFTIGSTTVTYTAVDVFRLMSTCSFVVIVEDRQAPVFTDCPSDIRLELPSTSSTLNFTLPATVTFDNSGEEYVTCNLPAWSILPYGQVTVLCTVTDPAWNSDECSFNVSIAEVTPPTFLYCPGNMSVNTGAASSGSVSWGQVTVVDNNGPPMLTTSHTPGEFPVGTTLVEYTATDIAGNIQVCAFNVTVIGKCDSLVIN